MESQILVLCTNKYYFGGGFGAVRQVFVQREQEYSHMKLIIK